LSSHIEFRLPNCLSSNSRCLSHDRQTTMQATPSARQRQNTNYLF